MKRILFALFMLCFAATMAWAQDTSHETHHPDQEATEQGSGNPDAVSPRPGMQRPGMGMMGGGMMGGMGGGMMGGMGGMGMGMMPGMMGGGMMGGMGMMPGMMGMDPGQMVMDMRIPQEKRDQIRELNLTSMQATSGKMGELQGQRIAFMRAVHTVPMNRDAAAKAWQQMQKLMTEMVTARLDTMAKVQEILGADTWQQMHPEWFGPRQKPAMPGGAKSN